MDDSSARTPRPWYRQFWPWFIVGILGSAVVASIATVVVAFNNADSLVRDDWYRSGVAINRRFEQEHAAREASVVGSVRFDDTTGEVLLELEGEGTGSLSRVLLELSHPTQASRDQALSLERRETGRFHGALPAALQGRWYATLEPADGATSSWRISRTLILPSSEPVRFGDGP